jgi:hypothetical protein
MGFRKAVTLICDGPCGTVIESTEKAPAGWSKLMISIYERLEQGQKPSQKPVAGWYCPSCTERIRNLLGSHHFALTAGKPEEQSVAAETSLP